MIKITFHYRYRKQIIIGVIILITLIVSTILIIMYYPKTSKTKSDIISIDKEETSKNENVKLEQEKTYYIVDIKGQIQNPGIYTIEESSRIIDVIEKAGGLTENANTTVLNLSKKITDEMVIIVYSNEEVANFSKTKEIEKQVQEQCVQKDENALKNDACIYEDNTSSSIKLISINNATLEEFMTLSGIGETKAKDIINYRTENGPFKNIEDLMNVPGIGESLFAKIKENITI